MIEKETEEKKESTGGPSPDIVLSGVEAMVQLIFQEGSLVKVLLKLSPDLNVSGMKAVMIELVMMLQEDSLVKELLNLSTYLMVEVKAVMRMVMMLKKGTLTSELLMAAIKKMAPFNESIKDYIKAIKVIVLVILFYKTLCPDDIRQIQYLANPSIPITALMYLNIHQYGGCNDIRITLVLKNTHTRLSMTRNWNKSTKRLVSPVIEIGYTNL